MGQFAKIVQNASAALLEDERLRSNMTDGEAKIVMDWALGWIESRVNAAPDETNAKQVAQRELTHVREMCAALNGLAKQSGVPDLFDAVRGLNASLTRGRDFSREELFYLLAALTNAAWQIRAGNK